MAYNNFDIAPLGEELQNNIDLLKSAIPIQ